MFDVINWAPPNYTIWRVHGRDRGRVQRLFDNRYGWHFRLILDGARPVRSHAASWQDAFNELEDVYIIKEIVGG
jgi:hypothetical protein